MPIFTDIDHVKSFIGGAVNVSVEMSSINPVLTRTAQNHLLPWLGDAQWNNIKANWEAPDAELAALLPYVQTALAMLGFYEYAHIGGIQFTESGIMRVENENHKSAYKYQENEYKKWMLENGYEAIEEMLLFLQENADDYPLWEGSEAAVKNLSLVINYARHFRAAADRNISRYTFEMLRPLIEDLEFFVLVPNIGQDQYDDIKTRIAAEDTFSDKENELIRLIQKCIANFTVEEATRRQLVRLEGKNVVQSEKLEPQGYEKTTTPGNVMTSIKINHHDQWGNRFVSRIIKYLDDNIDDFTLYAEWKEAEAEAAAEAATDSCIEAERPCDTANCFCDGECTCSSGTGKSVFRL